MPAPDEPKFPVVYERFDGAPSAPLSPTYLPRKPQNTALYRIVQEHLETFLVEPLAHDAAVPRAPP